MLYILVTDAENLSIDCIMMILVINVLELEGKKQNEQSF